MDYCVLRTPLDMHLHLRDGEMLTLVAPLSAKTFAGAVIMPNLVPPITTREQLLSYRERIVSACQGETFEPFMTLFFKAYSREELLAVKDYIIGIKLYPAGVTTNSDGGVRGMEDAYPTLAIMEELDIPLLVHGESHGFVMDREGLFLSVYAVLAERFPRLRIVMEHITTAGAIALLNKFSNLYATVTLQHLLFTLDDLAGGMLRPHLFCKPILKRPEDRLALLTAALSGHPKLMFGSDSAPHPRHKKECCGCAAGVFSAPVALAALVELFHSHGKLENLQAFVSDNAQQIYRVSLPEKILRFVRSEQQVPCEYSAFSERVIPIFAGESLMWSLKS